MIEQQIKLRNDNQNVFEFNECKTYLWKPKDDITTIELAKCLPMLVAGTIYNYQALTQCYQSLPDECKRHWELI